MLTENEIRDILHASRVVPTSVSNPHGPLGLEQLAEAVERITEKKESDRNQVQRLIALPVETWEKLDNIARELCKKHSQQVTASDVATALVQQAVNSVENL